jgi:predicted nucleotidyltransferase
MEREKAYEIAQRCARLLKDNFNLNNIYIFGSVTGDGIWHERSDIDIAVEGLPSRDYMRALNALYDLLPNDLKLDLITLEDMPAELKARIRGMEPTGGGMMPIGSTDRLKGQIELELNNLQKIARGLDEFLTQVSKRQPTEIELSGVGGYLQNFYTGVERIFERIAVTLDGGFPAGENWHTFLLQQMEIEYPGKRSAVINHELALQLLDYLRFRHLYRHTYGYELLWEKCRPLTESVSNTLKMLREQLICFLKGLQEYEP